LERVLITGGSGFLGQHLASSLRDSCDVIISSRNQKQMLSAANNLGVDAVPLDVSNYAATIEIFQRLKPKIVIHAAATKFVDLAEKYPNEAIDINILGSQNVARAAMQTGVEHVIGISTDKAAAPIYNLYGMTKATMERLYVSLNGVTQTNFSIVRYGNVAWSTGSVFPIWKKMLEETNHIVSTGPDMSRFFFSVTDAVTLVRAAFDNMETGGTELRRILDIWVNLENATWSLGRRRPGDRNLEFLLSEGEAEVTRKIELGDKPYFLMDPKQKTPIENALMSEFSSRSAEQFSDEDLKELILTPPADRFL